MLDDKSGNLDANGNVVTELFLDETNARPGRRRASQMLGKADTFVIRRCAAARDLHR